LPEYIHNLFSVVVLGDMNPKILNHDWLIRERITPIKYHKSEDPEKTPFREFISTPPFSQLAYKDIIFTVELNKFQLLINAPEYSQVYSNIAKKYFKTLPHTPLKKLGLNVSGAIKFNSKKEEMDFDNKYVKRGDALSKLIPAQKDIRFSFSVSYPKGKAYYLLDCKKDREGETARLSCNCEYDVNTLKQLTTNLDNAKIHIREMNRLVRSMAII